MKGIHTFCVGVALTTAFVAFAAADHHETNWKGWLADENCAKDYSKSSSPGHAGCATSCVKGGAKWALSTPDGHFILDLGASKATKHVGHEVFVKGKLNKESKTIKVSSISASSD